MLVSCSCDMFICPGQLGFSWPTKKKIVVPLQTQKTRPNPKNLWRYGHFRPIDEAVFWKLIIFWDRGNRNRPKHITIWTSQTPCCTTTLLNHCLTVLQTKYYCTVRSVPGAIVVLLLLYCSVLLCTTVLNCTDVLLYYYSTVVYQVLYYRCMYYYTVLYCTINNVPYTPALL